MAEILLDAFLDCLKQFPILLAVYVLLEWMEHRTGDGLAGGLRHSRKTGPLIGALVGSIPQCGFSAAMSELYSHRHVTLGALIAVFMSTSDEAIPLLLGDLSNWKLILAVILTKLAIGILFGYLVDLVWRPKAPETHHDHCEAADDHLCGHDHCRHREPRHKIWVNIFLSALKHAGLITLYLFIAGTLLGWLVEDVGLEALKRVLLTDSFFQPAIASLIGLIPNCAVSVLLVELYLSGGLSFASLIAGLSAGAGVGLLVLFRVNKPMKQNFAIVGLLYALSVAAGLILNLIV